MNITECQATFTVFFAIAWGATTNVQPGWKPFESAIDEPIVRSRWWLSFRWFNMAPVLYYVAVMTFLSLPVFTVPSGSAWVFRAFLDALALVACVVAAGAMFGFYRCWLGTVEQCPATYYFEDQKDKDLFNTHPNKAGKQVGPLKAAYGRRDWKSGWWYIAVSVLAPPVMGGLVYVLGMLR